jgi:WD40 repeat protein
MLFVSWLIVMLLAAMSTMSGQDARWNNVRYVGGAIAIRGTTSVSTTVWDTTVSIESGSLRLQLNQDRPLEIPALDIIALAYRREAVPDTRVISAPAFPASIPLFYMGWLRQEGIHFVLIEYRQPDRTRARVLLLVDKDVYVPLLRAVSSLTGLRIGVDQADVKRVAGLATTLLTSPLQITPDVPIWHLEALMGHKKRVTSAAFSPDGRWLATGSDGGVVLLWDVATRRVVGQVGTARRIWETRVVFSEDGRMLAVWHEGGVVLWDVEKRIQIGQLSGSGVTAVKRVAFSPDGSSLAMIVGSENVVRLVRVPGLQQRAELATNGSGGSVEFTEDGQGLIYWRPSGTTLRWPGQAGRPAEIAAYRLPGLTLDFNAQANLFAGVRHLAVILSDARTGLERGEPLAGHFGTVASVDFSRDGTHLASSAAGQAVVWDLATRRAIGQCAFGSLLQYSSVTLSPDGRHVALSGSGSTTVNLCSTPN